MTDEILAESGDQACVTCQNTHFPKQWSYSLHSDYETFKARLDDQLFTIQDDLLYSCITYGDGLQSPVVSGFTRTKNGLGYALLAFFASRTLGLYRLPFCPDRAYERAPSIDSGKQQLQTVLSELKPARVDSICAELQALYVHTQRLLREAGLATVCLKRNVYNVSDWYHQDSIGYAELLFKLKTACELAGRETLRFEMDVLNSYSDDGGYRHYPVVIRHEVSAEDVLYCSNFIRSRENCYNGSPGMAVEEGEWVVINRATDGVIEVPVSTIEINTAEWIDPWQRLSLGRVAAEQFISNWEPVVLRGLSSLGLEKRFYGGDLRLRAMARIRAAFEVLRTGRCWLG